jgi:diketogulonate reductase-like aldo/keto reductase
MMAIRFAFLIATASAQMNIPTREIAPGVNMPVVSIGSGQLSDKAAHAPAKQIVADWLALGGRGIDTAWCYHDQLEVQAAISESGIDRKDLFITTKLLECITGRLGAKAYVEYNLKQLNTTYIDLFLIHTPLGECGSTWSVLEEYHRKGVLRAIGVSNFNERNIEGLLKTATIVPHLNQIMYNVFSHDEKLIKYCKEKNITVEAYSPLGSWTPGHSMSIFKDPTMKNIAAKHNVSAAQVALKWIVQRGDTLAVLSANKSHQANDADLFDFELTDGDMNVLDMLGVGYHPPDTAALV